MVASYGDKLLGREAEPEELPVKLNENFSNVVIVDNIPIVDQARYERLATVIRKIFAAFGKIQDDGLFIPQESDGDKSTYGYAFVNYDCAESAQKAVKEGDNKKVRKNFAFLWSTPFLLYSWMLNINCA
jgi:translation initiation factor 3 subunit B